MGTEADLIKQSCWAEEEVAEEGKIIRATALSREEIRPYP